MSKSDQRQLFCRRVLEIGNEDGPSNNSVKYFVVSRVGACPIFRFIDIVGRFSVCVFWQANMFGRIGTLSQNKYVTHIIYIIQSFSEYSM